MFTTIGVDDRTEVGAETEETAGDYRTIILIRRFEYIIYQCIGEDQFCFRKGHGTGKAIGILKIITARCLVDLQRVYWSKLMEMFMTIEVEWKN